MLSGKYSQSQIERPLIVGLPTAVLLEDTFNSDVAVTAEKDYHGYYEITVELPFGSHALGMVTPPREDSKGYLILTDIFVGDPRLIGTGTGSRLLKKFVGTSRDVAPEITEMHTSWARLGCVNAIAKAFGLERLRIENGNEPEKHYGWQAEKSIEQFFIDHPVSKADYKVWGTTTNIDGL